MAEEPLTLSLNDFQGVTAKHVALTPEPMPNHPLFKDRTGQHHYRLLIVLYAGRLGKDHAYFCICDCGTKVLVRGDSVTCGVVKSCGCLVIEKNRDLRLAHGGSHSDEWNIWQGLKNRCLNPNVGSYASYGGRGITVCERWLTGDATSKPFECFVADMGLRPSKAHSIERRDNDGQYSPGNCVWALRTQQVRNTRLTFRIEFQGRTMSTWEWAEETGLPGNDIAKRIRRGWIPERALTQPLKRYPKRCS